MAISLEEQELLVRTGPGTPMGEVFRRYWMPAFVAERLPEPDCPPIAITILGERLVAFRDSGGKVGILDEACPHRGASLAYGRCEEGGLRCIYHGWKVDADGNLLEAPPEKNQELFAGRIKQTSYPTHEAGGLVWVYMGPRDEMPEFPHWRFCDLPDSHVMAVHYLQEANWLQALEGDIDAPHASYLHLSMKAYRERYTVEDAFAAFFGFHRSPEGHVQHMPWGVDTVWGYALEDPERPGEPRTDVEAFLVHPYVAPATSIVAGGEALGIPFIWHGWTPIDDEHHLVYYVHYDPDKPLSEEVREQIVQDFGHYKIDKENEYRTVANRTNRHFQDRKKQKTETYSGVEGIAAQDIAVVQSQGRILDRSKEHLGVEDIGVTAVRKFLLRAIKAVQEGRPAPRALSPAHYAELDGYVGVVPKGSDWRELVRNKTAQVDPVAT